MADPRNPRNEASPLYKVLTRLFSGPIVNYDSEQQKRFKRKQLDKYGTKFTSLSGKQFKKAEHNIYTRTLTDRVPCTLITTAGTHRGLLFRFGPK